MCEVHDTAENEDTEDIPVVDASDDDTFPVITNLKTWLRSDFEDFVLEFAVEVTMLICSLVQYFVVSSALSETLIYFVVRFLYFAVFSTTFGLIT